MRRRGEAILFKNKFVQKFLRMIVILGIAASCGSGLFILGAEQSLQTYTVRNIFFNFNGQVDLNKSRRYAPLLDIKKGDKFSFKKSRKSMENLYKTGSFENIEVRLERFPRDLADVTFALTNKFIVRKIEISIEDTVGPETAGEAIKKKSILNALYALRESSYFTPVKMGKACEEIKNFMQSRGCFNCEIDHKIQEDWDKSAVDILLFITPGQQSRIMRVSYQTPANIRAEIERFFQDKYYLPYLIASKVEKIKELLKKRDYYFPEVQVSHRFLDDSQTTVYLEVTVKPGFKYMFEFQGMENKIELISTIWSKKRFEKWAEKESRARILYYLHNKGYLDAKIDSKIESREENGEKVKCIIFSVKKNKRYKLGKISFTGNDSIPDKELQKVIKTDDQVFDSLFWLRAGSLYVDLGVLEQVYHFHGYPQAEVTMDLDLERPKAGIEFKIKENEKFTVSSITISGNQFFDREKILSFWKTKENEAFVQQVLNRDIENLLSIYHASGFDGVEIIPEISSGSKKNIALIIKEGRVYEMGNLVILGASGPQEKLLKKLFPLPKASPFDRDKVSLFRDEVAASAIFNEVKITYLRREKNSPTPGTSRTAAKNSVDVLVKVIPDKSKYYGFGVGWEDRKGLRGTIEYQGKNIFKSISSFSAMAQLGINERRGLLSYDTPYFLKNKINSSFKVWVDSEVYPSYSFNRYGLAESLVKKLSPYSYIQASLSWYRTELTELYTTPYGVDKLNVPFDTTALNFSYVREGRDDPFNPTQGDYFSSDIKVGFPLLEKSYSFIKFLWSYQRNLKFLKYGTLAFSVRNGFASGDMSITERFFAGGVHTFRGTKNDYLSPVDIYTGKPKGGNALILFNVEATFPFLIIPSKDLYYAVFLDIGNVFEKVNDFDMSRLERAIGFSIKIKTEMGPIRVDFGWNLVKDDFEWNVGIGNVF